jgi:hypothetical protein
LGNSIIGMIVGSLLPKIIKETNKLNIN